MGCVLFLALPIGDTVLQQPKSENLALASLSELDATDCDADTVEVAEGVCDLVKDEAVVRRSGSED
jgi:hypothetical protein